ncbi:hypothetical protein CU097_001999 [Rhizopus azygosporus]|uniref:Uncharacterized protein n=1 Tax=Rhizopus azygosporus TaxID=86630 RepID=A0A367JP04_RHIAZ|nr:hypothetical protein CU097_001999 [Rhizopus azygosporus]
MDSTSTSSTQPETVYVAPQQPEQPQQQPTVTTTLQEQQPQQQQQQPQQPSPPTSQDQEEECSILSPTLADILSDDRILRFYQCVKDIRTQNSPKQTAAMFFALCHALGDSVSFLKVPNMSKIMFRQEQQIFGVNVAGTQHDIFQSAVPPPPPEHNIPMAIADNTNTSLMHDVDSSHGTSNLFTATADNQHILQAALASVTAAAAAAASNSSVPDTISTKRRGQDLKGTTTKRTKKASPRDKEYVVRRNEIIQDLLKLSDVDLLHQANTIDPEVKLIIQGQERSTKLGALAPLHRFAAFANLPAHYDCDFAPKNAGVYFNYEYFQLYLAYRDLEIERQQQQQLEGSADHRPILVQCRADIEKVLVNTNWEAIRRRLTIGERIYQVCDILGRGFLLLSKQVSGRKLLHNFNAGEWAEFMREFRKPENQALLDNLQARYNPTRFYGQPQSKDAVITVAEVTPTPAEQ